mmetsp:Transcript_64413/g.179124  ORF Transcript_64413/g.179124 Transcript_64413/m.179124 type:complete len:200 (+) Transcript_64413:1346-1945(+)
MDDLLLEATVVAVVLTVSKLLMEVSGSSLESDSDTLESSILRRSSCGPGSLAYFAVALSLLCTRRRPSVDFMLPLFRLAGSRSSSVAVFGACGVPAPARDKDELRSTSAPENLKLLGATSLCAKSKFSGGKAMPSATRLRSCFGEGLASPSSLLIPAHEVCNSAERVGARESADCAVEPPGGRELLASTLLLCTAIAFA